MGHLIEPSRRDSHRPGQEPSTHVSDPVAELRGATFFDLDADTTLRDRVGLPQLTSDHGHLREDRLDLALARAAGVRSLPDTFIDFASIVQKSNK
jgi:hypothetical protein